MADLIAGEKYFLSFTPDPRNQVEAPISVPDGAWQFVEGEDVEVFSGYGSTGLVPDPGVENISNPVVLNGNGAWTLVSDLFPLFTGNGTIGLVPNPNDAGTTLFLREDGRWATPAGGGGGGGGSDLTWVPNEIPSGTIDGSNVTFVLANIPDSGNLQIYKNGVFYTNFTLSSDTITLGTAPNPAQSDNGTLADTIVCAYFF